MQVTGAISDREAMPQFLDKLEIERERGITIKAQSVRLKFKAKDGLDYILNLIDTPGHVDFVYEVSRSLAACEGAVLIVDASQGVEAQTLANVYLAIDSNLEIVLVLNKIDLPGADVENAKKEVEEIVGITTVDAVPISAKEGTNIREVLEQVVLKVPPPVGNPTAPLQALVYDAWFDVYQGVVVQVRVMHGVLRIGDKIRMMYSNQEHEVLKLGVFTPHPLEVKEIGVGEVGFLTANIKTVRDVKIGDTVTWAKNPAPAPLSGFKEIKPMVFSGIYPVDSSDYTGLKVAMEKLALNDASFTFEMETSVALGFGFRCGFLGLLHMEIIQERLEREFNMLIVTTAPTVAYKVYTLKGEEISVHNPSQLPPIQFIDRIEEPIVHVTIHTPEEYLGNLIKLCEERRGVQTKLHYHSPKRILLEYDIPFNEVVLNFYDKLKSVSKGYASMDYEVVRFVPSNLVKLDLLVNGEPVDALSWIIHKDKAFYHGRALAAKMKELIERQMFEIIIQAAIGSKIIARERLAPMRKNVLAKCYGGDISRKRKLLEKQKEGKKRMKSVGAVEIPQEAFLAALSLDD